MVTKEIELNVDFIGGQGSLTSVEEKEIHEFLKNHRISSKKLTRNKQSKFSKKANSPV